MKIEILNLRLTTSLFYTPIEKPEPFNYTESSEAGHGTEMLFCFDLDEDQYRSFEPEKDKIIKNLVFGGVYAGEKPDSSAAGKLLELAPGDYLFAQKRELLGRDEIIELVLEIQMEGLWQRLRPEKKIYLRYLFEDGKTVTQLFRPY